MDRRQELERLLRATGKGAAAQSGGERWIAFRALGQDLALPLDQVVEAAYFTVVEPLPGSPPWLLGVVPFQSDPVPLVDLRVVLGGGSGAPADRLLVVDRGGMRVALLVDSIEGLRRQPQRETGEGAEEGASGEPEPALPTPLDLDQLFSTPPLSTFVG